MAERMPSPGPDGTMITCVPRPRWLVTRPSSVSKAYAWRTVTLAMPYACASCSTVGSWNPTGYSPATILWRNTLASWR
ncbi:hypothetical protein D3C72_1654850 [compost metagenome]